jgi:hypothetical protein
MVYVIICFLGSQQKEISLMLLLFIPNRESPCNANANVYLTPIIKKLQEFWVGIDVLQPLGECHFLL